MAERGTVSTAAAQDSKPAAYKGCRPWWPTRKDEVCVLRLAAKLAETVHAYMPCIAEGYHRVEHCTLTHIPSVTTHT